MARNKDTAALVRRFKAIPRSVKNAAKPALRKGADEIVARIKHLAPEDQGHLKAAVRTEPGPVPLSITVVSDDVAALPQEYGTAKLKRDPSFWPAVNTLKQRVRRRVDRAIAKAAREEFRK